MSYLKNNGEIFCSDAFSELQHQKIRNQNQLLNWIISGHEAVQCLTPYVQKYQKVALLFSHFHYHSVMM